MTARFLCGIPTVFPLAVLVLALAGCEPDGGAVGIDGIDERVGPDAGVATREAGGDAGCPGLDCPCATRDDCLADQACLDDDRTAPCAGQPDCRCVTVARLPALPDLQAHVATADREGTIPAHPHPAAMPLAPIPCASAADCADGNPCTIDFCGTAHTCQFGLVAGCCLVDGDCNDGNPCTKDTCVLNACQYYWNKNCCWDDSQCEIMDRPTHQPCTTDKCVKDTLTGNWYCIQPYAPNCAVGLPYVQPFTDGASFADINWQMIDYGTPTDRNWSFAPAFGDLGPDGHLMFHWSPTAVLVKTVAVTPELDASTSQADGFNSTRSTTVQWRMAYHHWNPGADVTISVRASSTNDFATPWAYIELFARTTREDIPYELFSVQLPSPEKFSTTLRIGFMVDTGTSLAGTANMESLEVDDVVVAAGVPSRMTKSLLYRCNGAAGCNLRDSELVATANEGEPVPAVTAGSCDWYRIYMCMHDPDGTPGTWNFFGYPSAYIDGAPMDQTSVIQPVPGFGETGCQTFPQTVQSICRSPAIGTGYYVCALDVKADCCADDAAPDCAVTAAGAYRAALVARDETPTGPTMPRHSPFETQTKFDVTILIDDGYLVWSPNGRDAPAARAIADAILGTRDPRDGDTFRQAQVLADLDVLTDADLARFRGVFAVLGVSGNTHVVTPVEAARLKAYLDHGGRMVLEGGDFFSTSTRPGGQPPTVLHDLFRIDATSGGFAVMDGPLAGRNFLDGVAFDYAQNSAQFNSYIDRLVHRPGSGSREILRNAGATPFATTVSFESTPAVPEGPFYRTIGSSILFGGLVPQAGQTTVLDLMGRTLDFLEVGYPDCTAAAQCQDDEVCTSETCLPADADGRRVCGVALPPGMSSCTPCTNDVQPRHDGQPACGIDEACDVAQGFCVPIPSWVRFDAETGTAPGCGVFFGDSEANPAAPASSSSSITIPMTGIVDRLHVKAKVPHLYRGDIQLTLTSPGGTTVLLKAADPLDPAENVYATYDVGIPSDQPVSTFQGESLQGAWTLTALDALPSFAGGFIEEWHLYATMRANPCDTVVECAPDPCSLSVACADTTVPQDGTTECVYAALCDDHDACTRDICTAGAQTVTGTGTCTHALNPGAGCTCATNDDCLADQACLNPAQTAACAGQPDCRCVAIPGAAHEMALPTQVAIPDDDAVTGVTVTLVLTGTTPIDHLKVRVATDHPFVEDLRTRLCHLGTCVTLRDVRKKAVGEETGSNDVYDFDVVAGPGTLDDFRRMPVGGAWDLNLFDVVPGETGSLKRFALYVQEAVCFFDGDCSDGEACTADTCDSPRPGAPGVCRHTLKPCGMPYLPVGISTACVQPPQCIAATGFCPTASTVTFEAVGTACDDGRFCTVDDRCDGAGGCSVSSVRDCSALDGPCVEGWCDPVVSETLKACQVRNRADGHACDDGEPCNGAADTCRDGVCGIPFMHPCRVDTDCGDDGNKCNGDTWWCGDCGMCYLDLVGHPRKDLICKAAALPCHVGSCVPATGLCMDALAPDGDPCDDGNVATTNDTCSGGLCIGGV